MAIKLPHMPIWVYDLEADEDCSLMSLAEYGAYMRLLQRQWIEGSVPVDMARLARLLRVTIDEMESIWPVLAPKFAEDGRGRLKNHRLDQERESALRKVEVNKANGKRGGRPKKTERLSEEKPNGSIRVSGSGSGSDYGDSSSGGSAEGGIVFPLGSDCLDTPEFRAKWAEWIAYRRERKLPRWIKRTVQSKLLTLAKAGHDTAIATIQLSIDNGYNGLDPAWLSGKGPGGGGQTPQSRAEARRAEQRGKEHPEDAELAFK